MFIILEILAEFIVYKIFTLSDYSKLAQRLEFFIYNVFKVFILILVVGFIVGIARELITPEKTRKILSGKKTGIGNLIAAFLAIITPVEEFSIIPVFVGFLETGIPSSIAFTYLITAPITNEVAFALFWGLFGYKTAILYYITGIIIGLTGGMLLGLIKSDKYIQPLVIQERMKIEYKQEKKDFKTIIIAAKQKSLSFFEDFWLYIIIGVGIAALIKGYIPSSQIIKYVGTDNPVAVPMAVLMVMFFYINISMALPIIMVFIGYSLPIGTIMAFIMAVTATSIPELMVLKRALRLPLLLVYIITLLGLIIITGYLLNFIFASSII